jgi:hypothetical protein
MRSVYADGVAALFDEEVDNGRWGKGREGTRQFYEALLGPPGQRSMTT